MLTLLLLLIIIILINKLFTGFKTQCDLQRSAVLKVDHNLVIIEAVKTLPVLYICNCFKQMTVWSIHLEYNTWLPTLRPPFTTLTTHGSHIVFLAQKHNAVSLFHVMHLPRASCPIHKVFMWIRSDSWLVTDVKLFPLGLSGAPVSLNPRKCCHYSGRDTLSCCFSECLRHLIAWPKLQSRVLFCTQNHAMLVLFDIWSQIMFPSHNYKKYLSNSVPVTLYYG